MQTWTFPLMAELTDRPRTPDEMRAIAARIETAVIGMLKGELVSGGAMVIALDPQRGIHQKTDVRPE